MSLEIGKVYATVDGDTRLFSRSMGFVRKEGESTAKYVARSFNQVGDAFQSLGKKLTLGLTVPLVAGLTAGVREAALLEGAIAKFDVVFRGVNDEMHAFVDGFRNEFPIARSEIVKSAAALQDLMVPMGVNREEAAGMTQDWLKLAGALSAFNDVPIQDVLTAIQSGLAGSSEPLRRFGIDAREAALQQTALAHGLTTTTGQLSSQVRMQALLIQATNQSSDAINGLEEQKGSLLWVIQGLKADLADLAGAFGAVLLPQVTRVAERMRDALGVFNSLNDQTKAVMVTVAVFGAALGPVLFGLGGLLKILPLLATGFAVLTGPVGLAVAAIAGGAILIYKNWDMLREFFTTGAGSKMFDSLKQTATTAFNAVVDVVGVAVGTLMGLWNEFGDRILSVAAFAFGKVMSAITFALEYINSALNIFRSAAEGNWGNVWKEMQNIVSRAVNYILESASSMIVGVLRAVNSFLEWAGVMKPLQGAVEATAVTIESLTDSLKREIVETDRATGVTFNLRDALGGLFKATEEVAEATKKKADADRDASETSSDLTDQVYKLKSAYEELNDVILDPKLIEVDANGFTDVSDAIDLVRLASDGMNVSINQLQGALAITQQAYAEAFGEERRAELQAIIDNLNILIETAHTTASGVQGIGQGAQFAMSIANEFTNSFGQGMANIVVQGGKLVDTLKNIGRLLASSIIQRGLQMLLTGGTGGMGGIAGGLIGKIFGRASGGTVLSGQPYMVGEKGPELFVPNVTGTIQPNGAGGGNMTVVLRPVVQTLMTYDGLAVRIQQSTSDLARRGGV